MTSEFLSPSWFSVPGARGRLVRLALCLAMLLLPSCERDEHAPVRIADDALAAALQAKDGAAAVKHLSKSSLDLLTRVATLARTAQPDALNLIPPSERMLVLCFRMQSSPEELRKLSGAQCFERVVGAGFLPPLVGEGAKRRAMVVSGSFARVEYSVEHAAFHVVASWVFEDGGWKLDLLPTGAGRDVLIREQARVAGSSVNDWIIEQIAAIFGRPVPQTIWKPGKPNP